MAKNNNLTEEQQKELLFLKSTYEMHCKTREEAMLRGKTRNIDKIDSIIDEVVAQMSKIDSNFAKKCVEENSKKNERFDIMDAINNNDESSSLFSQLEEKNEETDKIVEDLSQTQDVIKQTEDFYSQFDDDEPDLYAMADKIETMEEKTEVKPQVNTEEVVNNTDPNAQYDIIPLPSKGECYMMKIDRLPVGYLTASDENLITSPNLYESGNITSILLKKKILNKDINVDNLISGDVDAIMVFLRGTSYGNDFPIVVTDPKTGKRIETTVDLSKLKYKPFSLKGDENGYFDFTLPRLGHKIKFKFLTKKEEKLLQKINKKESQGVLYYDINEAIDKIKNALKEDEKMNDTERNGIIEANDRLQKWADNIKQNNVKTPYTKSVTNTMEMQIVSINGNNDKKFIHESVMNMPASDSLAFRRYVYDNQPGVDFEVEVERPVSDGGGTFNCFLEWDDFVFWHIA